MEPSSREKREGGKCLLRDNDGCHCAQVVLCTSVVQVDADGSEAGGAEVAEPRLLSELRRHLETQDRLRATFGNTYSTDGNGQLVFCQPNGKYLHIKDIVARDFHKIIKSAGLPRIRFHDLKHCTASYLTALGVDGHTVSVICGHHSSAFTQEHYVHTIPATVRDAMKKLGRALSLDQEPDR